MVRSATGEGEFVRFVVPTEIHPDSETAIGVITIAAEVLRDELHLPALLDELRRLLDWLVAHLPEPERFSRTTSKGHYRRKTKGLSWFRPTATEAIAVARERGAGRALRLPGRRAARAADRVRDVRGRTAGGRRAVSRDPHALTNDRQA